MGVPPMRTLPTSPERGEKKHLAHGRGARVTGPAGFIAAGPAGGVQFGRRHDAERKGQRMYIRSELSKIIINEASPQQIIFLKEVNGDRTFPIMIGVGEALAIDRRLKGISLGRPMTHDLLANIIAGLGGRLQKILINDLRRHTFIATLIVERDGEIIEVDSRPSDAIALGVGLNTPIFVADRVFEEVFKDALDLGDKRKILEARRGQLAGEIVALQRQFDDSDFTSQMGEEQTGELRGRLHEMRAELEAIEELLRELP